MGEAKDVEAHHPGPTPANPKPSLWSQSINPKHADLIALLLCFVTGLCDSSAYNAWTCFLAMQTGTFPPPFSPLPSLNHSHSYIQGADSFNQKKKGNTIFLGLGASSQPFNKPWGWLKSLISIISFFLGATTFSTTTRLAGPLRRGTLFTTFTIQSILIFIAVALIEADLIPHDTDPNSPEANLTGGPLFLELIPIALLAFQSAGSIAVTRALGFNEIPSVVLTSVYFDLASDPALVTGVAGNVKRNRRAGAVVMLVIGAIVGGWLSRSAGGMESALWLSGGIKFLLGFVWFGWWGN